MRYLGLDLGSKTLGISISDTTNNIASVYTTLRFDNEDYHSLAMMLNNIIKDNNITTIILGYPKNMNNTISERANITLQFKEMLEDMYNIDIELEDERLTSVISNKVLISSNVSRKKRKKYVDGMSSVIILQGYLDRKVNYK